MIQMVVFIASSGIAHKIQRCVLPAITRDRLILFRQHTAALTGMSQKVVHA